MKQPDIWVIGGVNWDTTLKVATLPAAGESLLITDPPSYDIGGKGLNQAVAAQRAGAKVALLGATGEDSQGDQIRQFLTAEGIDTTKLQALENQQTGTAYITVDESAENTILVALGANAGVPKTLFTSEASAWSGVHSLIANLEVPVDVVKHAFGIARQFGVRTVLNPSPMQDDLSDLLSVVDVLIVNESEAAALVGSSSTKQNVVKALDSLGIGEIVLTRGKHGSTIIHGEEVFEVTAPKVAAIDPTAAGDTFLGYYVANRALDIDPQAAAERATEAAAICVTRSGATSSIPVAAS